MCSSFITFQHIPRPQKKFEIINFEWLNTKLLELIYIVSSDCRTVIFSNSLAVVYSAELLISLNDYSNLVTWQMPLSHMVLLVTCDPLKLFKCSFTLLKLISFQTQHWDKGLLNARRFHFQCDLQNMVKYFSHKSKCPCVLKLWWYKQVLINFKAPGCILLCSFLIPCAFNTFQEIRD